MKRTLAERFTAFVDTNGPIPAHRPELGPCHMWTGCIDKLTGYGRFAIEKKKKALAHRVAFRLKQGREARPCALHRCDNRPCVNGDHLYEGTKSDNARDMVARGRLNFQAHPESRPRGPEHQRRVREGMAAAVVRR